MSGKRASTFSCPDGLHQRPDSHDLHHSLQVVRQIFRRPRPVADYRERPFAAASHAVSDGIKACKAIAGSLSTIRNSAFAGPVGSRRACSQF
jgi:hypothetical protein